MGLQLEDINAGPIKWYHGEMDQNTSCDAARRTAKMVKSLDFKSFPEHDYRTLQEEEFRNLMDWLMK